MEDKLRLAISPCPNDTFMFDALINGRIDTERLSFDVEYLDIEELNRGVVERVPDFSKISCAVLPMIAQELEDEVINQHIALFINQYSLSLGESGRTAIRFLTGE